MALGRPNPRAPERRDPARAFGSSPAFQRFSWRSGAPTRARWKALEGSGAARFDVWRGARYMRGTRHPGNPTMNASKEAPPAAQSSEEALLAMRRSKAEALRARGENPFPNAIDTAQRAWVGGLRARFAPALADAAEQRYDAAKFSELASGERVLVLGRVIARRGFGKLTFLR